MKITIYSAIVLESLLTLISFSYLCQVAKCETEQSENRFENLSQQIKKDTGGLNNETFTQNVENFKTLLGEISFEPNLEALPDTNAITPDGSVSIRAATEVAIAILRSENVKLLSVKTTNTSPLIAIDLYVEKLNRAIDPKWTWSKVYANVGPPAGTPNAASGMDPESIADPEKKKGYLELIKKNRDNNLRNGQQTELRHSRYMFIMTIAGLVTKTPEGGWNKTDVIARFCKDDESKALLEKCIQER